MCRGRTAFASRSPTTSGRTPSGPSVAGRRDLDPGAFAKRLVVERGLRAKLEPVSLLTGQYMVSLSLGATSPPLYVGAADGAIEIPAVESTRERVMDMLEKVPLDAWRTRPPGP